MKIVSLSDSHMFSLHFDNEEEMKDCDFLIHSGDLTSLGNEIQTKKALFELKEFGNRIKAKNIILIGGNHDDYLEQVDEEYIYKNYNIHLINNKKKIIDGYSFGGYISFKDMDWAFNTVDVDKILSQLLDVDFLVSHSPPYGVLDEILKYESHLSGQNIYDHMGDKLLANYILAEKFINLKALFCGHAHEGRGSFILDNGLILINSCLLDEYFRFQGNPVITVLEL